MPQEIQLNVVLLLFHECQRDPDGDKRRNIWHRQPDYDVPSQSDRHVRQLNFCVWRLDLTRLSQW